MQKNTDTFIVPGDNPKDLVKEFYFNYNLIIDTGNHIFYYQRPIVRSCGNIEEWDKLKIPYFLGLKPNDIIQIPSDNIEQFLKLNMLNSEYQRWASIASTVDTIKSSGLFKIMSLFNDTLNNVKWIFRKTTIEENIVLQYKKSGNTYSPDEIKWDSTKTLFPETIQKIQKAKNRCHF